MSVQPLQLNQSCTSPGKRSWYWLALPLLLHLLTAWPDEPVFNGDSNRHVMTSVFFRDFLADQPVTDPVVYAEAYYRQYPALGLLVWPPLFHMVTGLLMLVCGTSVWVARGVVAASSVVATCCVYRICVRRMVSQQQAVVAASLFSVMPMVYLYSRHVMLEMPTLALCLLCLDQFDVWLRSLCRVGAGEGRVVSMALPADTLVAEHTIENVGSRHLYVAAICAALAALTRFDAIVLLPTLLLMCIFERRLTCLCRPRVFVAALLAVLLVAPVYFVIWKELGHLHLRQAVENVSGRHSTMLNVQALLFYPNAVTEQGGILVACLAAIGLPVALSAERRRDSGIFLALLAGTYITFTPLAERTARHAIYWLPAVSWLSVLGALQISRWAGLVAHAAEAKMFSEPHRSLWSMRLSVLSRQACVWGIVAVTAVASARQPVFRVTGYRPAAQVVLNQTVPGDRVFFDGWWDGNFTYQLRHLDSSRSRHVIRGDKLLYDFTNVPTVDFQQYVTTDFEILQQLFEAQPVCVAFEDPQPFGEIRLSRQMRALVRSLPDIFVPVWDCDVVNTVPRARPFRLFVFRVNHQRLQQLVRYGSDNWEQTGHRIVPGATDSEPPEKSPEQI